MSIEFDRRFQGHRILFLNISLRAKIDFVWLFDETGRDFIWKVISIKRKSINLDETETLEKTK